jgi:glutamyl-tRNA reductase
LPPAELNGSLYRHRDSNAVRHLFRVAAGLDSMLLGEAEILGQVREAYRIALDHGATGPVLNRMFQGALEVGKRVRTETEIGTRPVSVAFAGVKLSERIFGRMTNHRALIVGAGATSEQVVRHLCDRGIKQLRVLNRTAEHAVDLAVRFGGEVVPWENLPAVLEWPDLIVTSVSSAEPILTRAMLECAMAARGNRALLLIDLGVPRNVAADAADLYNTYLYNIDDLTEIIEQNKKAREAEIPRAEAIIEEQIEKFMHWQAGVATGAVIEDLRKKLTAEREAFLHERLASMPHLSERDRTEVAAMLEEFLDRVVLDPAERLRGIPELRRKLQNLDALRDLFHLGREKP